MRNVLFVVSFILAICIALIVGLKLYNNSTKEHNIIQQIPLSYSKVKLKNYQKIFVYLKNQRFVKGILIFKDYKHLLKDKKSVVLVFNKDNQEKFLNVVSGLIWSKKSKYFIIKYYYIGKNEKMNNYVIAVKLKNNPEIYLENGISVKK